MNSVSINIERLYHLLKLFRLSRKDLVLYLNEKSKSEVKEEDIFKPEIKLSLLKKIDSVFKKGLNFYLDPKDLEEVKEESIFFRKNKFNADLNLGAKQIVNKFEEEKIELSALSNLSNFKIKRVLPYYSLRDNPETAAREARVALYPRFTTDKKTFLKSLIDKLANFNILVFEFVETWNKKEKANIFGFFLSPNVIVLKRDQKSLRREIFTLSHELGHYLLNEEEIDEQITGFDFDSSNKVEKWCNNFAYHFLAGDYDERIQRLEKASNKNDYHRDLISAISENTNLSTLSLYTRLLMLGKISINDYNHECDAILDSIKSREEEEKQKRKFEKEKAEAEGRKLKGSTPKPIQSPLLIKTIQTAYLEGVINEAEFCRRLNIKPEQFEKFLG